MQQRLFSWFLCCLDVLEIKETVMIRTGSWWGCDIQEMMCLESIIIAWIYTAWLMWPNSFALQGEKGGKKKWMNSDVSWSNLRLLHVEINRIWFGFSLAAARDFNMRALKWGCVDSGFLFVTTCFLLLLSCCPCCILFKPPHGLQIELWLWV